MICSSDASLKPQRTHDCVDATGASAASAAAAAAAAVGHRCCETQVAVSRMDVDLVLRPN